MDLLTKTDRSATYPGFQMCLIYIQSDNFPLLVGLDNFNENHVGLLKFYSKGKCIGKFLSVLFWVSCIYSQFRHQSGI